MSLNDARSLLVHVAGDEMLQQAAIDDGAAAMPERLVELGRRNGLEFTVAELKDVLEELRNPKRETPLGDDELGSVVGGWAALTMGGARWAFAQNLARDGKAQSDTSAKYSQMLDGIAQNFK
jgi:hypothetical protein